jgi:threonine dehydratase
MAERKPSVEGVAAAAKRIADLVTRTPLLPLDIEGRRYWVKAECLQQSGSFKLRGASNRLVQLREDQRARGVVAFSSGNHAQGVAMAAQRLGVAATAAACQAGSRLRSPNRGSSPSSPRAGTT